MASWFTKLIDKVTPWDRNGEVQRRQEDEERKRREEQNQSQIVRPTRQPQQVSPNSIFDSPTIKAQKTKNLFEGLNTNLSLGQSTNNKVDVSTNDTTKELEELKNKYKAQALEEEKKRTSWFDRQFTDRNWDKRAEATAINRATREYQDKHGWNADSNVISFQQKAKKSLDEADKNHTSQWVAPVISAGRVGTGIAQGVGGLYDLATPGKGQNRFTQATTRRAEEQDKLAKDLGVEKAYKVGNVIGEVASYLAPTAITKFGRVGEATRLGAKAMSDLTARSLISGNIDDAVRLAEASRAYNPSLLTRASLTAGDKVDELSNVIGNGGRVRQLLGRVVGNVLNPANLAEDIRLNNRYLGQQSARGEAITPRVMAETAAQSVLGGFAPEVLRGAGRLISSRGKNIPFEGLEHEIGDVLRPDEIEDIMRTDIPVRQGIDVQAPPSEGVEIPVRTPTNEPGQLIRESSGDARFATPDELVKREIELANRDKAFDFNKENQLTQPEINRSEGVTPGKPEQPFSLDENTVKSNQDSIINGYAGMLRDLGEGNGVALVPDGERYGYGEKRVSNNVRFGDTKGKKYVTKQGWIDEAERQLRNGEAYSGVQEAFDDAANPDVQSMLAKGERPDVPQGKPIQVKEVKGIDVTDKTEVPTNLPETPGQVRVTEATAPMAAKSEAVAQQPTPQPTVAITPESSAKVDAALDPNSDVKYRDLNGQERRAYRERKQQMKDAQTTNSATAQPENLENPVSENGEATIAAERQRKQVTRYVNDKDLKKAFKKDPQLKNNASLEELNTNASNNVDSKDINQIINDYGKPLDSRPEGVIGNAQDYVEHIHAIKRLEKAGTPEAKEAAVNALDALSEFSSRSGYNLQATRVLYDEMPATMKVNYMKKVGNKIGSDLTPEAEETLFKIAEKQGEVGDRLSDFERKYSSVYEKMRSGEKIDNATLAKFLDDYDKSFSEMKDLNGQAIDVLENGVRNKSSLGARYEQNARLAMLSSVAGRGFDMISTGFNVPIYLSKSLGETIFNNIFRRGTGNTSTLGIKELFTGAKSGLKDLGKQYYGKGSSVENFDSYLSRITHGRGENIGNPVKYGRFGESKPIKFVRNTIHAATDLPTALTRGVRDAELARMGKFEARKINVPKENRKAFVEMYKRFAPDNVKHEAEQAHLLLNNLHTNEITKGINDAFNRIDRNIAKLPDGPVKGTVNLAAKQFKLITAPFTSFMGGAIHQAATDRNVLWNIGKMIQGASIKDGDMIAKAAADLGTNISLAGGAGYLMAKNGMIVKEDAEGNSYDGMYIKIGNTYIPIGITNQAVAPIILGANLALSDGDIGKTITGSFDDTRKALGVASQLSGSNSGINLITNDTSEASVPKAISTAVGQHIPAITGDVNSVLNRMDRYNPTREVADTSATKFNPDTGKQVTDQVQKAKNQLQNKIPFLSQQLPRKVGTNAQNFGERILKANSTSPQMRDMKKAKDDKLQKDRSTLSSVLNDKNIEALVQDDEMAKYSFTTARDRGLDKVNQDNVDSVISKVTSSDARQKLLEDGNYDSYVSVNKLLLDKTRASSTATKKDISDIETSIKRGEFYKDKQIPYDLIDKYNNGDNNVSLEDWRKLEEDDPEMYQKLWAIDEAMTKAGIGYGKNGKQKYYAKKSGSGKGRGGGSGSRKLSAEFGTLGESKFAPKVQEYQTIDQKSGSVPIIRKIRPNIVHQIRKG